MKSWNVIQPALNLADTVEGFHRYEVSRDRLLVEPTGKERGELFVRYRSPTPNETAETLTSILKHFRDFRARRMLAEQKSAARLSRASLYEEQMDVALAHDRLLRDLRDSPEAAIAFLNGTLGKVSNPHDAVVWGRGELRRLDELLVDGSFESIDPQGQWPSGFRRLSSHYHRVDMDRSRRLLNLWLKNMIRDSRESLAVALETVESGQGTTENLDYRRQIAAFREAVRNDRRRVEMLSAVRVAYLEETERSLDPGSPGVTVVLAATESNRVWLTWRSVLWGLAAGIVAYLGIVGFRRRLR